MDFLHFFSQLVASMVLRVFWIPSVFLYNFSVWILHKRLKNLTFHKFDQNHKMPNSQNFYSSFWISHEDFVFWCYDAMTFIEYTVFCFWGAFFTKKTKKPRLLVSEARFSPCLWFKNTKNWSFSVRTPGWWMAKK